ncbi:MAG TPA: hypothetical protein DEF00_00810 [Candidatus Taylorbacteria bacterium]|nr:MAG: hypothetical protein UY03_C0001G0045 [Parcubacteria group bacterium GW2011_GWA2_47_64]KKU96191.1 MAG: hypothetical protein UY29_C0015G0031 [Parcubacteria group bacterium GW2011_GWC2_48_17]HBV00921.1 hypothetical protein [Candidatus Taylorbacteria bacterium]
MIVESLRTKPEEQDDDMPPNGQERVATGPLSDADDIEVAPGQAIDTKTFLERLRQLQESRNPEDKVNVASERENVDESLGHVAKLIEKEKEKSEKLGAVRQDLGVPHEDGETLQKLEEARKTLEEEQRHIELAGEYNDVLDSFSELSREELEHIAETGETRKGESVQSKYGKEIHSDVAKELASMHLGGKLHVTWGALTKLGQVADKILHDMVSAVKGIFRGPESGGKRTHAE